MFLQFIESVVREAGTHRRPAVGSNDEASVGSRQPDATTKPLPLQRRGLLFISPWLTATAVLLKVKVRRMASPSRDKSGGFCLVRAGLEA